MPKHIELRTEYLVEIASFLVRRWSGHNTMIIELSDGADTRTRLAENRIIVAPLEKRMGSSFARYRQFRTSLWYEAMRVRFCKKILSNDHAFGFILNTMETQRVEHLGRRMWGGMDDEIIYNYTHVLASRPRLSAVYGKARIVEAFYQYFTFGVVKGEIPQNHFERVRRAAALAREVVCEAVTCEAKEGGKDHDGVGRYDATHDSTHDPMHGGIIQGTGHGPKNGEEIDGTQMLERHVSEIIRILDIDSLLTIPISLPFMKAGMALSEKQLRHLLKVVSQNKKGDGFGTQSDPEEILSGERIRDEYCVLLDEDARARNKGVGSSEISVGARVPSTRNVNEAAIYDAGLINGLKTKFKQWKSGWSEQYASTGDEFDEETYIEGDHNEPFITDVRRSIRTRIVILLDHSSSISSDATEYKKATLALCEVLAYLRVRFAVYAFSTQDRSVVCWSVKPDNMKWSSTTAKRLARIVANGSTPLAEVYDKMFPILQSGPPDILLTLTDGEPSDPNAVRNMTRSISGLGVSMVALGLGPNTVRATAIANNLKYLGYEKTVAVSRLNDIPGRVLRILQ